jgi:hypothetical protein
MEASMPGKNLAMALATVLSAALLLTATTAADAKSRKHHKGHRDTAAHDRRSADEREYDRARAKAFDPGGSYSAYPDWARYALSPKSLR